MDIFGTKSIYVFIGFMTFVTLSAVVVIILAILGFFT